MNILSEWLSLNLSPAIQSKLLGSLGVIIFVWLCRLLVLHLLERRIDDVSLRYRRRKTATYILAVVGIVLVGRIWLKDIQYVATYLGLISAGLAIALQGPISNLAGWALIVWRRPFEVGDRVQVGNHAGDIIDLGLFKFTVLEIGNWVDADQSTGRILQIPNSKVFSEVFANYSKGFEYIWHEIPVLVTFESDWQKAKTILQEIINRDTDALSKDAEARVREAGRRFMITYSKLTPIVYTTVQDNGVLLTIRYLCQPRRRRSTEEHIWEDILLAFAQKPGIDFAYPTQRHYHHWIEEDAAINKNLQKIYQPATNQREGKLGDVTNSS